MPNWCSNILIVKGEKEELQKFKKAIEGKENNEILKIDFNKIIPNNSEELREEWNKLPEDHEDKKRYVDYNEYWFNKIGHKKQSGIWGTKWNVGDCGLVETDTELKYMFDTAWSPCMPIVEKLIETYSNLNFYFEYEETGMCFGGIIEGEDGMVVSESDYEIRQAECFKCGDHITRKKSEKYYECSECGNKFTQAEADKHEEAEE